MRRSAHKVSLINHLSYRRMDIGRNLSRFRPSGMDYGASPHAGVQSLLRLNDQIIETTRSYVSGVRCLDFETAGLAATPFTQVDQFVIN